MPRARLISRVGLLAGLGLLACMAASGAARDRVAIDTGSLQGATADGVISFRGVPFAAPPVGPLRWSSP